MGEAAGWGDSAEKSGQARFQLNKTNSIRDKKRFIITFNLLNLSTGSTFRTIECSNTAAHYDPGTRHAPNLSNIFALACISRRRYFASKIPSEPELAPVSVNRSSLSEPL